MPQKEHSAHKTGNNLLSHNIEVALPLAIEGLTAVVGMGTGVSPHPWSPESVPTYIYRLLPIRRLARVPGLENNVKLRVGATNADRGDTNKSHGSLVPVSLIHY